jgi:hypothetical protein
MADVALTTTFQKLVDTSVDNFLLSFKPTARANVVEIVTTATPDVFTNRAIHHLVPAKNEAGNRASIGSGHVYGRVQSENASVTACVTTWA